ncbi:PREDICTED: NAC domain-containing protein 40 [Camelina sativa]|uniref:NAC domain-containing protein 40 n=1 Tax=Camelina sativa TaxID=90675 RepID=A0ABM0SYA0_CAMSA|nr:PREDICTED: NAC domain-containing protein 40 [Camelina sativa]
MSKEAEMSIAVSALFPGFRFSPTDVELISYYLRRKIDGDEHSVAVIAEVEIYKFEPWDLPEESKLKSENEWFYFCARGRKYPHGSQSRRATQLGYWKATGKERSVKSGNQVVGTKRTLVFHIGRAPRGERTEWIMHEYCIHGAPQDALVVCRLRKNADFRASSSQRHIEDGVAQDDGYVGQSGGSEKEEKSYSVYDSELQISNGDIAESSNVVEDQAEIVDDCYAEILNDDIIKLDEEAMKASQASRPTNPTQQETIFSEASSKRSKCGIKKESKETMNCYALFRIKNVPGTELSWRFPNPFHIKKDDSQRLMKNVLATTVFLAILVSFFWTILIARNSS